jgi:hypothetical protein
MAMTPGEFIGQLLHGVTVAHVFHLRSRSYAQHVALADLYAGLQGSADDLAESYQGAYGLIEDWPASFEMPEGEPLEWLQDFSALVVMRRKDMPEDSEIQNTIDEIQGLINRTLYRLRFLA